MNNIFIVTGASGSGKGTIIEALSKLIPLERIITTTTRPMRPHESDGRPYHFITKEKFAELEKNNIFVERAQAYNDEWYGVQKEDLEHAFTSKKIVLWEVDFKGVKNIKKLFPKIKSVLVDVPEEVFRKRLKERDALDDTYIESRIQYVREHLKNTDLYDYTIKNEEGQLEEAVQSLKKIIEHETSS